MENNVKPWNGLERVPVGELEPGKHYWIVAPTVDEFLDKKRPGTHCFTVGVYERQILNTYTEPTDEEKAEIEEDADSDYPDDWSSELFCIKNGKKAGDLLVRMIGDVAVHRFIMLPTFYHPWDNSMLQNVTSWHISRKWRPSRMYSIDIPEEAAVNHLEFYTPAGSIVHDLGFDLSGLPPGSRFNLPIGKDAVERLCHSINNQCRC